MADKKLCELYDLLMLSNESDTKDHYNAIIELVKIAKNQQSVIESLEKLVVTTAKSLSETQAVLIGE